MCYNKKSTWYKAADLMGVWMMLSVSVKKRIPRFRDGEAYYDYNLVAVIILLIVFGLIML